MNCLADSNPDALPLLFLRSGGSLADRQLLEAVLMRLKGRSVSTLVIACSDESAEPYRSAAADVLCVAEPELLSEQPLRRCRLLSAYARRFSSAYDLLLIDAALPQEGGGDGEGVQFNLLDSGVDSGGLRPVLHQGDRAEAEQIGDSLYGWLERKVVSPPLWTCLLIGGKSSRMGRPKHLIEDRHGVSWAERLASLFSEQSDGVVLAGAGEIPDSLTYLLRLADSDDTKGPLAGIVAAMRWKPQACWLVSACDMPLITPAALRWLLTTRRPGMWGSVPFQPQSRRLEPLFAHYDFRAKTLFEEMVSSGHRRLSHIGQYSRIATPPVPDTHRRSWRNCNSPEDLYHIR